MLTSYTHDFKCQTLNDSSKALQSITYGFDHMTTNLDVNFFLWHQSAWRVLRIAVKINTKEERVLNITLSSMIFILFMVTWPVATKLYHCMNQARKMKNIQLMVIYNKLTTIFLELI